MSFLKKCNCFLLLLHISKILGKFAKISEICKKTKDGEIYFSEHHSTEDCGLLTTKIKLTLLYLKVSSIVTILLKTKIQSQIFYPYLLMNIHSFEGTQNYFQNFTLTRKSIYNSHLRFTFMSLSSFTTYV